MLDSVIANCRKGRGVETHGKRGDRLLDQSGGRGVPMRSPGGAGGVVFSDDLTDSSGKIDEEIIFKIAGRAGEIGMVLLGKMCDFVDKRKELWPETAERFDDTGDNRLALSSGVSR